MKNSLLIPALAFILISLLACELDITSDVYVSDLRDVATKGTAGLTTPATIAIQIPSMKKCDEYSDKLSEIMKGILFEFSPKSCKRDGMSSYLVSDAQIPIVGSEEAWRSSSSLFGILAEVGDDGYIYLNIANNAKKFDQLNKRVSNEFRQSIDLAESKITLVLHNDERETATFLVWGVFLNGKPIYYDHNFTLKRRHTAEIELSNVGAAYLEENEYVTPLALIIEPPSQEAN